MQEVWYQVLSLGFGYFSAAVILLVVIWSIRKVFSDHGTWSRLKRDIPEMGAAGKLRVLSASRGRIEAGQEFLVPYEGTVGSALGCDIVIPSRKVHLRAAFLWMDDGALHMVPLHRDGFEVDGVAVEPGDEAVLSDGAILVIRDLKLIFECFETGDADRKIGDDPYVTHARRILVHQGKGAGIGNPGKAEKKKKPRGKKRGLRAGQKGEADGKSKRLAGQQKKADSTKAFRKGRHDR